MTILGIIFSIGAIGCAFATNIGILIAFRFILGLAVGSASANVPVYIAEIAPNGITWENGDDRASNDCFPDNSLLSVLTPL
ncbi:MFS transporter (plasmid) [Comamonas sp. C11]|nr:MFS transporter [Comamonas sp. C11]UUC96758.1 MFS transporter [Comamonas sp. C11]